MKIQNINGEDVFASTSVTYTISPSELCGDDLAYLRDRLQFFYTDPNSSFKYPDFSMVNDFVIYIEYAITDDSERGDMYLIESEHESGEIPKQTHYPDPREQDDLIEFCEKRKDDPAISIYREADINPDHYLWRWYAEYLGEHFPDFKVNTDNMREWFSDYITDFYSAWGQEDDFMASQGKIREIFDNINADPARYDGWIEAFVE